MTRYNKENKNIYYMLCFFKTNIKKLEKHGYGFMAEGN